MDNIKIEEFQCCFCNNGIDPNGTDPCDLSIVTNIDKDKSLQSSQWFFCHVNCFKSTIHPKAIAYFVLDDKKRHGNNEQFNLCFVEKPSYEYICYLCYQGIESKAVDPCDINIMSNIDKDDRYNQTFYFHACCFKPTLHPYMQGYFVFANN